MPPREGIYGLLAEFNTPTDLVRATEQARAAGYRRMECYTPYPVEEAAEALRLPHYARSADLPARRSDGCDDGLPDGDLDQRLGVSAEHCRASAVELARRSLFRRTSGRSLFSGLSAAFGMIALNGLPQLYHPVFNAPNFRNGATTDKFFLCVEAHDPKFSAGRDAGVSGTLSRSLCGGGKPLKITGN